MSRKIIFVVLMLLVPFSLSAEVISANMKAINECIDISNRGDQYGEFGSKSRGLSLGTNVSYILLALQELNEIDYSKVNMDNNRSIFQICSSSLLEFGYKSEKYIEAIQNGFSDKEIIRELQKRNNFIKILRDKVLSVNSVGGLVVFVAWGKNGRPQ